MTANYDNLPKPLKEVTARWTGNYRPIPTSPINVFEEFNEIGQMDKGVLKEYRIELTVGFLHQVHPDVPVDSVRDMTLRAIAKELYFDIYEDLLNMTPEINEVVAQMGTNSIGTSLREKYEKLLNRISP